jgi:hypothetical protein
MSSFEMLALSENLCQHYADVKIFLQDQIIRILFIKIDSIIDLAKIGG